MTVAELIKQLQALPQDREVHINDEDRGNYYENITAVFGIAENIKMGWSASVVIAVNS